MSEETKPAAKSAPKPKAAEPKRGRAVYGLIINPATGQRFQQESWVDVTEVDGWITAQVEAGKIELKD